MHQPSRKNGNAVLSVTARVPANLARVLAESVVTIAVVARALASVRHARAMAVIISINLLEGVVVISHCPFIISDEI